MAEVSRNLVAILLVLVIIVSAVGTWSLFSSRGDEYSAGYDQNPSAGSGLVALSLKRVPQDTAVIDLEVVVGEANNG